MPIISIVVPCYNEEEALPLFYQEATRVAGEMSGIDFEFVFIDDGSRDNTLSVLRRLAAADCRTRPPCCPSCIARSPRRATTAPPPAAPPAQASLPSGRFSRACFTG